MKLGITVVSLIFSLLIGPVWAGVVDVSALTMDAAKRFTQASQAIHKDWHSADTHFVKVCHEEGSGSCGDQITMSLVALIDNVYPPPKISFRSTPIENTENFYSSLSSPPLGHPPKS